MSKGQMDRAQCEWDEQGLRAESGRGGQVPAVPIAVGGWGLTPSVIRRSLVACKFQGGMTCHRQSQEGRVTCLIGTGSQARVWMRHLLVRWPASGCCSKHQCFWLAGAGQEGAMFVHARSYEDLTESEDGAAPGESPKEGAWGPPLLAADMCQISHDSSELSTQLIGVA